MSVFKNSVMKISLYMCSFISTLTTKEYVCCLKCFSECLNASCCIFTSWMVIISQKYLSTNLTWRQLAATGWNESPELTEVIFVNGQEFVHYKSSLKKMVPKTEWIEKTVDPEYWERERQRNIRNEQAIKAHVVWLMERLNQTSGE